MTIKRSLTAAAAMAALFGGLALGGQTVLAENPDNNSTSLNQDLGTSSSTSSSSSTTTSSSSTSSSSSTTTSSSSTTETSASTTASSTEPAKGGEAEKLPEAGANDGAIAASVLALAGGMMLVAGPKLRKE